MAGGFEEFFQEATGGAPDAVQAAVAAAGLSGERRLSAGADTTATGVLPWLFRRLVSAPESTPRRLVYVLPADSLPEHAFARIGGWLERLGLGDDVGLHLLAGAVRNGGWLRHPERTAILVGTHDLLLSRALMRGFADSRRTAPVAYGLLNNDAQWVFGAAHLLGPGLATSVRLQQMRDALGTSAPTATMWMSSAEEPPPSVSDVSDLVQSVAASHGAGTQTAVILGSLLRARALYGALREAMPERDIVLIHPFFRASDRRDRVADLAELAGLAEPAPARDRIVVGTRALQTGIAGSPHTLLTESGTASGSSTPPASWSTSDLLALFDTAVDPPDLDVASWVCEPADLTALVAWREWETGEPSEDEPALGRDELCPVPLDELRGVLDGRAWLRDPRDGLWRRAAAEDLAPGAVILLNARSGGYLPDQGWSPASTTPVPPVAPPPDSPAFSCVAWVSLDQHLAETEEEARDLIDALPGLPEPHREAVILAARYHDLGKCHDVFQEMLRAGGGDPPDILLAKSKAPWSTGQKRRPYFRHELVSALMLSQDDHWYGDDTDHRLVTYLVAAHHGHVRISVHAQPDEAPALLGVIDGDRTPPVTLSSGETFPSRLLQTAAFRPEAGGSWTQQARALRDRPDLGPFRLAYLEALVRISDWRSSARHDGPVEIVSEVDVTVAVPAVGGDHPPRAESGV